MLAISLTELLASGGATKASLGNVISHNLAGLGNVRSFQQLPALLSVMQGASRWPHHFSQQTQ